MARGEVNDRIALVPPQSGPGAEAAASQRSVVGHATGRDAAVTTTGDGHLHLALQAWAGQVETAEQRAGLLEHTRNWLTQLTAPGSTKGDIGEQERGVRLAVQAILGGPRATRNARVLWQAERLARLDLGPFPPPAFQAPTPPAAQSYADFLLLSGRVGFNAEPLPTPSQQLRTRAAALEEELAWGDHLFEGLQALIKRRVLGPCALVLLLGRRRVVVT